MRLIRYFKSKSKDADSTSSELVVNIILILALIIINLIYAQYKGNQLANNEIVNNVIISLLSLIVVNLSRYNNSVNKGSNKITETMEKSDREINSILSASSYMYLNIFKKKVLDRSTLKGEIWANRLAHQVLRLSDAIISSQKAHESEISAVIYIKKWYEDLENVIENIQDYAGIGYTEFEDNTSYKTTALMYELCKEEVVAVSYANIEFWESLSGLDFLEFNRIANDNDIKVSRFFIIDDLTKKDELNQLIDCVEFHLEYKSQKEMDNYSVYVVTKFEDRRMRNITQRHRDVLDISNSDKPVPDISMFDNKILSSWDFGQEEDSVDRVRIIIKEQAVTSGKNIFEELKQKKMQISNDQDVNKLRSMLPDTGETK